jgi:hypothetical protein
MFIRVWYINWYINQVKVKVGITNKLISLIDY